jgi:hypothetical protein
MSDELMAKFEREFEKVRKDLKIKASLDELDSIFFVRDYVLKEGFVSPMLSRQICRRISDTFMGWVNYLHGLIAPNPNHMINMNESTAFNEKEKEELAKLISKTMILISANTLAGLSKNKADEAKFIDDSVDFWYKEVQPKGKDLIEKIKKKWEESSSHVTKKEKGEPYVA